MKRGIFALIILLLGAFGGIGYLLWQDREIVFENRIPPTAQGEAAKAVSAEPAATSTERRGNIFEFPDMEKATGSAAVKKRSAPKEVTVTYTESGWSPAVARVAQGGTVTFANKSGEAFQPAANPHPAHTSYEGFDAKEGIPDGESFIFIFESRGMVGYHDHLSPERIGVINVE